MLMDNQVNFDTKVFDTHYLLLENIKFCDTTRSYKEVFVAYYLIN